MALEILEKLLDQYMTTGQIRIDLDKKIIAWHILETQLSILDYIEHHYRLDMRNNIQNHKHLYDLDEGQILSIAKQFVEIQKNGFSNLKQS